jgi:hypothetical protein
LLILSIILFYNFSISIYTHLWVYYYF